MKILHTADWHIGNFPGPEKDGKNLRLLDTLNCLKELISVADRETPDLIVVSGDIFHQARVWADRGLSEVQTAIDIIEELAAISPVVVLRGTPNHDGSEQFEVLEAHFKGRKNHEVHIITYPQVVTICTQDGGYANVACLPGFDRGVYRAKFPGLSKEEENQVFSDELKSIVLGLKAQCKLTKWPSIFLSHYTVPGCNVESGQTQFLAQFEPVIYPDTLDSAGFDLVALGHIHRPQQVPSCRNTFYSGAVNAMNFNDEGQDRGFYIHDLIAGTHKFFKTPSRPFATYHFTDTDITAIVNGEIDTVARNNWKLKPDEPAVIDSAIVRILYTCSEENDKAFNRSILEQRLYADGAFWVQEISAEQVTVSADKTDLSEKTNPEENLIAHLREKGFPEDRVGSVVETARPIISEALAGNITSQLTGVFLPLEISVKNYRNYVDEHFDFRDISFCTVNGANGAGKSSLFMDAILDCLYEEPREGELTGWIRSDEEARSGSITFTFSIGEKTFRVARTRAKSGKATLNLAELVNDEWESRSAEKIRDTQERIVDILGMDSLTFKACALIMQDQYGLFLQADKADRMVVLGNILGLGIYDDMEQLSREKLADANRAIGEKKLLAEKLSAETAGKSDIQASREAAVNSAEDRKKEISKLSLDLEGVRTNLAKADAALERVIAAKEETEKLGRQVGELDSTIQMQKLERNRALAFLADEPKIVEGAADYTAALEAEKVFASKFAELTAKHDTLAGAAERRERISESLNRLLAEKTETKGVIARLQMQLNQADELREAWNTYHTEKKRLELMEGRSELYYDLSNHISEEQAKYGSIQSEYASEAQRRKSAIEAFQAKAKMLESSGCSNIDNADCVFLADAKRAKETLRAYLPECTEWKRQQIERLHEVQRGIDTLIRQRDELGFDPAIVAAQRSKVAGLQEKAREYESLDSIRERMDLLQKQLDSTESRIGEAQSNLQEENQAVSRRNELAAQINQMMASKPALESRVNAAREWAELEKKLPVMREKLESAENRLKEVTKERVRLSEQIAELEKVAASETLHAGNKEALASRMGSLSMEISAKTGELNEITLKIGGLDQLLRQIENKETEIKKLLDETTILGDMAARYEILKAAFSQDGIPHNIVRSMLPVLSSTANSILSQMTGGHMGLSFVTDKVLKSNNKKEVPTLDIVIEEYGKGSLPYLSKSGGEKVKSALAVILALAEVKSSQAGIRLGMLFIDEPPFLDADGTQAYCDALEAIQHRYGNLKVMAITHDPTMKARFPQSVDVTKTENGSKVSIE